MENIGLQVRDSGLDVSHRRQVPLSESNFCVLQFGGKGMATTPCPLDNDRSLWEGCPKGFELEGLGKGLRSGGGLKKKRSMV